MTVLSSELLLNSLLYFCKALPLIGYDKRHVKSSPIAKRVQIPQETNISKLMFRKLLLRED